MRCMHACLVPGETSEITIVLVWYAIPYTCCLLGTRKLGLAESVNDTPQSERAATAKLLVYQPLTVSIK